MNKVNISKLYKLNGKKSLCKRKSAGKCVKVRGCKFTKGKTRKYCRKRRNKTYKK